MHGWDVLTSKIAVLADSFTNNQFFSSRQIVLSTKHKNKCVIRVNVVLMIVMCKFLMLLILRLFVIRMLIVSIG